MHVQNIIVILSCVQIVGLVFGATPWLKNLVIGDNAPLRVIQDSVTLLGYVFF